MPCQLFVVHRDIKSQLEFTNAALGAASANIASSESEVEHYTEEHVHLEVQNTFLTRELLRPHLNWQSTKTSAQL